MSNARNLARLLPNTSGQLPTGNLQDSSVTVSKLIPSDWSRGLSNSGYQKLAGGLIIQWGRQSIPDGGTPTVTFPVAFPNSVIAITTGQMTNNWGSNVYANGWTMDSYNNSSFVPHALTNGTNDFGWIAIGY